MTHQLGKCFDCDEVFSIDGRDTCPNCKGSVWTPYDPEYTMDSDPEEDDEFGGSKEVDGWRFETREREGPQPNVQELHIRTEDDWEYRFREPNPDEGYELYSKYRSDGTESDDDVVPVSVVEYIDDMTVADLNYAKLVVHPSSGAYTPPSR